MHSFFLMNCSVALTFQSSSFDLEGMFLFFIFLGLYHFRNEWSSCGYLCWKAPAGSAARCVSVCNCCTAGL